MHSNLLSSSFGLPLTALILEISHQFFLLGVYRNHRLARSQMLLDPLIDVLELRVPVRVVGPFTALAHTLQTVTHFGHLPVCAAERSCPVLQPVWRAVH